MIRTRPQPRPAAELLLALEAEDQRLYARIAKATIRRRVVQQEIRGLRCGLSRADEEAYRKLRFIREGK